MPNKPKDIRPSARIIIILTAALAMWPIDKWLLLVVEADANVVGDTKAAHAHDIGDLEVPATCHHREAGCENGEGGPIG